MAMSQLDELSDRRHARARVLREAATQGFWLSQSPDGCGGRVWTWLVDGEDRIGEPFRTRGEAIRYMRRLLAPT
jgi:hypothetical protein